MPKPNFSFVMFMILEKKFTIQHLLFKFNQNFNSSNAKNFQKSQTEIAILINQLSLKAFCLIIFFEENLPLVFKHFHENGCCNTSALLIF